MAAISIKVGIGFLVDVAIIRVAPWAGSQCLPSSPIRKKATAA